jgi:hypothetical protein
LPHLPPAKDLTISRPFGVYCYGTNYTNLISGRLLSAARLYSWRFMLTDGTNSAGLDLVYDKKNGGWQEIGGCFYPARPNSSNPVLETLQAAERLPQVKKGDCELRYLNFMDIQFFAVWLHGKSSDIILPVPVYGKWQDYRPYSEHEMIELLKREVEDKMTNRPARLSQAEAIVEGMRGLNMQPAAGPGPLDDGRIDPRRREEIIQQLRLTGTEAVSALIRTLKDPDVQMRRNSDLVIIWLAGGYDGGTKMDMQKAIPALSQATKDKDGSVRAWAALALGEIGPDAKEAVLVLIKLVRDPEEGCRNDACIALGDIGPAAKDALPALRIALNDPSKDVRQFAKLAIDKIQMRKL